MSLTFWLIILGLPTLTVLIRYRWKRIFVQSHSDARTRALPTLREKIEQAESILNQREVTPEIESTARRAIDQCKRHLLVLEQSLDWISHQKELGSISMLPGHVEELVADCPRKPE